MNNRRIIGYNTQTGEPIYENNNQGYPNNFKVNNYNSYQNNMNQVNVSNNNIKNNKKSSSSKIILVSLISGFAAILLILLIVIFIGTKQSTNSNVSRTVMIYMVGSDLESQNGLGTIDLEEIDYYKMDNQNVNVLLIAGGSNEWYNDYIDKSETSIYELTGSGYVKVKSQNIQNMGNPEVLSNFLNYVYSNYKTDKYDLIFWNHGGAIQGSEFDEVSNDFLSLSEIKSGLSISPFNENNKLELVIFATCLNGTVEVADTLSNYADYLVASEEATIGTLMNGDFNFINNIKITDSSYDVAYKFIEAYKNKVINYKQIYTIYYGESDLYSTYSIVDLSKIKELENSINDFFEEIDLNNNYNDVSRIRSNLYQYAYNQYDQSQFDMVDLYNLVDNLYEYAPDKANKVKEKFKSTVLYNWATNSESRGLSIYFPYNGEKQYKDYFLTVYQGFDNLKPYNKFINDFYNIQTSSTIAYNYTANEVSIDNNQGDADFMLQLTDEQKETFAKAGYIVFRDRKDGYFLPVYSGFDVKLDGNTLKANIKDRQLQVKSTEDGTTSIVITKEIGNTDEYIKYNTVVALENIGSDNITDWKFDSANMTLVYDKKTGKVNIGSVILINKDESMPNTIAVDLNDYTHVVFGSSSYKILDEDGNYVIDWESNGVYEGFEENVGKFDFELNNYDDGYDYYCVFRIWDTNNNSFYSKLVKMN